MIHLCLILALILVPVSASVPPGVDETAQLITLRILPLYQIAPLGRVSYRIQIPPHRDNVWFCFGWDNYTTSKGRTSCQQLNGIYTPRTFYQDYTALMAGCYGGFVDVYRAPYYRAASATQRFRIESPSSREILSCVE